MNTPYDNLPPRDPTPVPPQGQPVRREEVVVEEVRVVEPRRSPGWLLPLLLLLGVGLLAWYFLGNRDRDATELPPMDAPATSAPVSQPDAPAPIATKPSPDRDTSRERTRTPAVAKVERPRPATDREPSPIARVRPEYPPEALRAGEEGTVVVRALVGADGLPQNVEVARSSRSRLLDRAAVEAVRKWRFAPAMDGGKRVAAAVEVPVDFVAGEYR